MSTEAIEETISNGAIASISLPHLLAVVRYMKLPKLPVLLRLICLEEVEKLFLKAFRNDDHHI